MGYFYRVEFKRSKCSGLIWMGEKRTVKRGWILLIGRMQHCDISSGRSQVLSLWRLWYQSRITLIRCLGRSSPFSLSLSLTFVREVGCARKNAFNGESTRDSPMKKVPSQRIERIFSRIRAWRWYHLFGGFAIKGRFATRSDGKGIAILSVTIH